MSCVVCTEPCPHPVSGQLPAGGPCCAFAGWLCATCLDRSRTSTRKCPLCKSQITAANLPFPQTRVDERLEMLTYDCCVEGCARKGVGDARALAKHLVDVHGSVEKTMYEREVKVLHFDHIHEQLCKAQTHARATEVKYGAAKASLRLQARQFKRREESLLIKHAQQLSKQEAVRTAERQRYESLLQEKRAFESEAYARLGELCFEHAAKHIQRYGELHDVVRGGPTKASNADSRSRSPRSRIVPP